MPPPQVIRLHPDDGVVIARATLLPGAEVAPGVGAAERIPAGHKVAVRAHAEGEPVRRYGQVIGFATRPIAAGQHVHVQNLGMGEFARDYAYGEDARPTQMIDPVASFQGIRRADGRIATRNYVGLLTTVNCSATVAAHIAGAFQRNPYTGFEPLSDFPNVDGVVELTHKTGCGMAKGEPLQVLRRTLAGYARHPNFSHVIVLGLGCEVNQIGGLLEEQRLTDRVRSMDIQAMGGVRKTVEAGMDFVREVLAESNAARRESAPASELMLALQCGGSDGYSGITANPALGYAADLLVKHGGTAILSETPEIYGAEHLLTRRARTPEVGQKLVDIIHWWEDYTKRNNMELNNNPSPGNKLGGLTTILEKSLGAAAKGGTTPLNAVYHYADPVTEKGFVFMDTPGYDPVSATGQVAGGANVLAFTTGRGSAYGCKPTPSIKIATNSEMYHRMIDDMDVNGGEVVEGSSLEEKGQEIFEMILRVASGEKTKSELLGYGDNEFVPWQIGATV